MEEIYANADYKKHFDLEPSSDLTDLRKSHPRFNRLVIVGLGVLSVLLLAGLVGLGVHYHSSICAAAAELAIVEANLTALLQVGTNLSSVTEEKNRLERDLTNVTEELNRLQNLINQKKTCPAGWEMFSSSCFFVSTESGSWTHGRDDCLKKGADLVIIDWTKKQTFLSGLTKKAAWIGLNDGHSEGNWKWVDGTLLTLNYWGENQPDNAGEEDCAHIRASVALWNDLSCSASLNWICEKAA